VSRTDLMADVRCNSKRLLQLFHGHSEDRQIWVPAATPTRQPSNDKDQRKIIKKNLLEAAGFHQMVPILGASPPVRPPPLQRQTNGSCCSLPLLLLPFFGLPFFLIFIASSFIFLPLGVRVHVSCPAVGATRPPDGRSGRQDARATVWITGPKVGGNLRTLCSSSSALASLFFLFWPPRNQTRQGKGKLIDFTSSLPTTTTTRQSATFH